VNRTPFLRRVRALALAALSGSLLSIACGDGDPTTVEESGGSTSAPPGSGVFPGFPELDGEYSADCAGLTGRMRDCGILTEGEAKCSDPTDPVTECIFQCMADASCSLLAGYNCGGSAPVLSRCIGDCQYVFCADGYPIPTSYVCDAENDCLDGSDEVDCEYFVCSNGRSIAESKVCNGLRDCVDGSDEHGCPGFDCPERRIPFNWVCDAEEDCSDGSDEVDCTYVVCANDGTELPLSWQCDLEHDCLDGSDEVGCAELLCR
jgi:hypothetical protein